MERDRVVKITNLFSRDQMGLNGVCVQCGEKTNLALILADGYEDICEDCVKLEELTIDAHC